ncbi:lamin tail domain-containing protein [Halosolutus halophilus]|uniref:lamin tail domain-containing protein n=1 Tax=Halosolutus halophilus TaxID=1552990 RepID=UPI0022351373|nr:lamin tail domain-containing protein [Halosolutus halophilus]
MNRRKFLTLSSVGVATGTSGCLTAFEGRSVSDPDENEAEGTGKGTPDVGLRFVGVYADEIDREFIDGEYLLLENVSEDSLDVSGYAVEYPSDHTYQMEKLILEPSAQLILLTREGEDATLTSSPPAYLRYAGFDAGSATSVLGVNGTVCVRNTHGSIITDISYDNFGCDGGTSTPESGDEIECLH